MVGYLFSMKYIHTLPFLWKSEYGIHSNENLGSVPGKQCRKTVFDTCIVLNLHFLNFVHYNYVHYFQFSELQLKTFFTA